MPIGARNPMACLLQFTRGALGTTTWGGSVVAADDGTHHMCKSSACKMCALVTWNILRTGEKGKKKKRVCSV